MAQGFSLNSIPKICQKLCDLHVRSPPTSLKGYDVRFLYLIIMVGGWGGEGGGVTGFRAPVRFLDLIIIDLLIDLEKD